MHSKMQFLGEGGARVTRFYKNEPQSSLLTSSRQIRSVTSCF